MTAARQTAAWHRFRRAHPHAVDGALALVLFAVAFPGSRISPPGFAATEPWWPGVLVTGVGCVCLLWRRSHVRAVAVATGVCGIVVAALGYLPSIFVLGPLLVALYTLAERTGRRSAYPIGFAAVVLVCAAAVAAHPDEQFAITVIAPAASLLLPLSLGSTVRIRRDYVQAVQARAQYAEQTREREARHRVAEERMRIARELHDVVAHHLALANAQAGTVAHLMRARPEQAQQMVAQLAATTSAALRELKATVGLLRDTDDPDAPLQPAPGLARLPELTAALAAAGLQVTVTTEGDARPLSAGVDLTAYRIIQEALTNVTKHAATDAAQVRLRYGRDRLTVTVTNLVDSGGPPTGAGASAGAGSGTGTGTGSGNGTGSGGFGLIGMRERARSVGGAVHAARRADGVFDVTAHLPLTAAEPEEGPQS